MDASDEILWAMAERECRKISGRAIRTLQRMDSAIASDLGNAWNDLCVQVQGQESMSWQTYIRSVTEVIIRHLHATNLELRQAIWLHTPNGLEYKHEDGEEIPLWEDEIEYILHEYVLPAATNWTNTRIRAYLFGA